MTIRSVAGNAAVGLLLICAVVMTVSVVRRGGVKPPTTSPTKLTAVSNWPDLVAHGHRMGSADAPVTILEFGDFECPACGAFARITLRGVRAKYGDSVALVFRNWPLSYHHLAFPTARAAECAAVQGRFDAFYDAIYDHQDSLGIRSYHDFAQESGVADLTAFDQCVANSGPVPAIEADVAAVTALHSGGTPTLLINGMQLGGLPDSASFDHLIAAALRKAAKQRS